MVTLPSAGWDRHLAMPTELAWTYVSQVASDGPMRQNAINAGRRGRHRPAPWSDLVGRYRFGIVLIVIVVFGFAARVVYVLTIGQRIRLGPDAIWYELQAGTIANGSGYLKTFV